MAEPVGFLAGELELPPVRPDSCMRKELNVGTLDRSNACFLTTTTTDLPEISWLNRSPTSMPHILKNPDGTVNFDAVQKETAFLKA